MFPSAAGFIPVEIRLLHYRDFHLKSKSALVQRPESTGVNPAGSLVSGLVLLAVMCNLPSANNEVDLNV
jgi:hypothetical protein